MVLVWCRIRLGGWRWHLVSPKRQRAVPRAFVRDSRLDGRGGIARSCIPNRRSDFCRHVPIATHTNRALGVRRRRHELRCIFRSSRELARPLGKDSRNDYGVWDAVFCVAAFEPENQK